MSLTLADIAFLAAVQAVAPAYDLFSTNCEGTGTEAGWTDTGVINWDYTTVVLEGSHSLRCTSGGTGITFSTKTAAHAAMLIQLSSYPASTTSAFGFRHSDTAARGIFRINSSGQVSVYASGSDATPFTTDAIPLNTPTWAYLTFAENGLCTAAFSTDGSKPTSGSKFASKTAGAGTTALFQIGTSGVTFDKIRGSTTPIGANFS